MNCELLQRACVTPHLVREGAERFGCSTLRSQTTDIMQRAATVLQEEGGIIAVGHGCPEELHQAVITTGCLEGVTKLVRHLLYTHAACVNVHQVKSSQQLIVVKTYVRSRLTERESHQVEQEIMLQQDAHHEHVVAFWLAFDRGANRHVVMEYCEEGDLRCSLAAWSEASLRAKVIVPLLQVLAHIHDQGIVHRDIKPDNIFMQRGAAKLGDFGLAVSLNSHLHTRASTSDCAICSHSLAHSSSCSGSTASMKRSCSTGGACSSSGSSSYTVAPVSRLTRFASTGIAAARQRPLLLQASGTPAYTAPEVLEAVVHGRSVAPAISPKNDIWSLGLVALEAMTGRHPFAGPNSTSGTAMLAVLASKRVHVEHACISPAMQDWLQLALAKDPSARADAQQLLSHHWVTSSSSGSGGRSTPLEGVAALGCRSADHLSGQGHAIGGPSQPLLWGLGGISSWED